MHDSVTYFTRWAEERVTLSWDAVDTHFSPAVSFEYCSALLSSK